MKKRLIGLMLAGAMLTGVGSMAGCEDNSPNTDNVDNNNIYTNAKEKLSGTNLIVAVYKKKIELHRADIYSIYYTIDGVTSGYSYAYNINDRIDYKCGKQDDFTRMYFTYDSMPDEADYDILCEECFADINK